MRPHSAAASAQSHVGSVFDQYCRHTPDRRDPGFREDRKIAGRYLHCATILTAVRSLMELFDGRFLAASSAAAQAAAGSPFWNLAQARLVQASLKSGASWTASSSTACASRGRLA